MDGKYHKKDSMSRYIKLKDGFLSLSRIDFECPYCGNKYSDEDDKYLNKCNSNKGFYTRITYNSCMKKFAMTYNVVGDAVSFK